jgi:hypothetical protein
MHPAGAAGIAEAIYQSRHPDPAPGSHPMGGRVCVPSSPPAPGKAGRGGSPWETEDVVMAAVTESGLISNVFVMFSI